MPFAIAGAGIAAAGSIAGGLIQSQAAGQAASAGTAAAQNTLAFQQGVYNQAQSNQQPYVNTGQSALGALSQLYGLTPGGGASQAFTNYTNTPAYTFALQQGELGANRSLAASGLTASGAQAKALTQYAGGYASQGFNNYISGLASLSNLGQTSATSLGQLGNQAAQTVGQANQYMGNAQAAGAMGQANALSGMISGVTGAIGGASGLGNAGVQNYLQGLGSGSSYGSPNITNTAASGQIWNANNPVGTESLAGVYSNPALSGM